jgi:hypothetical protein
VVEGRKTNWSIEKFSFPRLAGKAVYLLLSTFYFLQKIRT